VIILVARNLPVFLSRRQLGSSALWLFFGFFAILIVFAIIGVRLWVTVPQSPSATGRSCALAELDLTRGHRRLFGVLLVMWLNLAMSMVAE
jgi:hypothetical protein